MSTTTDIELAASSKEEDRLLDTDEAEDWDFVELRPRHTIFLSHSGAQKNFVEQLYEDLGRAKQTPFFDKRPDSLPKGEKFAQLIFQAARQCELAVVVVSEEYFSRSKWPMLELVAFVQARHCVILPLFFGLSCKEFSDVKRRQLWFKRWEEWAQEDARIRVDVWKEALKELDRRNGLEYAEALGEVTFRREVVATACSIVQIKGLQNLENLEVLPSLWERLLAPTLKSFMLIFLRIVFFICFSIIFFFIFIRLIVPIFEKYMVPKDF